MSIMIDNVSMFETRRIARFLHETFPLVTIMVTMPDGKIVDMTKK